MRRRLLNLLTVLSLLLWVVAATLWVRSEWVDPPDRLGFGKSSPFLVSSDGGVGWNYWLAGGPPSPSADWGFLGFGRYTTDVGGAILAEWRVPYWFLALATGALPTWCLARSVRRRGPDRGFEVTRRRQPSEGP